MPNAELEFMVSWFYPGALNYYTEMNLHCKRASLHINEICKTLSPALTV